MESSFEQGTLGVCGTSTMPKQQIRLLATSLTTGKNDSSTTDMTNQTPKGLPPKSPSSATVRIVQSTISAVPRRRSKGRGNRRGKRSANAKSIFSDENSESSSHSCERGKSRSTEQSLDQQVYQPVELIPNRSLLDPGPNHMNVTGNADDFFSTPDLNMVSFESTSSPTSVVEPLSTHDEKTFSRRHMNHHRTKSWDLYDDFNYNASNAKACLPSIFRRQKVMSADVASVGNASDTLVMVGESGGRISGRDLHEKAKEVLNAGDYSRAVMMFEALQKAQIDRFGKWHSSVGAATHNVAVVRLRMGQAESAEDLFEEAVAIRRKVLGNDHLDLAASLTKLGSARVARHKFDDGLQVLREALRVTRNTLGRSNKTVAQILCHIACLYFEAGELFSAQATFEDALDIYREVFSSEPDRDACMAQMTEVLCNIGSIHNKRKSFSGAIECFREALDLQRGIMGHDHPRVIASLDNLGYSFSKNKSYNQALICYKEMLTAQLSLHGFFTTECCDTLKKKILIYEKMKDLDGAIKAAKKALERVCLDTPIPENSVTYEIEQILSELKQKIRSKRRSEF